MMFIQSKLECMNYQNNEINSETRKLSVMSPVINEGISSIQQNNLEGTIQMKVTIRQQLHQELKTNNWVLIGQKSRNQSLKQSDSFDPGMSKPQKFTPSKEKQDDRKPKTLKQTLLSTYQKSKPEEPKLQKRGRMTHRESADDQANMLMTARSRSKSHQKLFPLKFGNRGIIQSKIQFACKTDHLTIKQYSQPNQQQQYQQNQQIYGLQELTVLRERLQIATQENQLLKEEFSAFKRKVVTTLRTQQSYIEGIAQQIFKDYHRKCQTLKFSGRQKQFSDALLSVKNEDSIVEIGPEVHKNKMVLSMMSNRLADITPQISEITRRSQMFSDCQSNRASLNGSTENIDRKQSFQRLFCTIQQLKSSMSSDSVQVTNPQPNSENYQQNRTLTNNILKTSLIVMENCVLGAKDVNENKKQSKKSSILKTESRFSGLKQVKSPTNQNCNDRKIECKALLKYSQSTGDMKKGLRLR